MLPTSKPAILSSASISDEKAPLEWMKQGSLSNSPIALAASQSISGSAWSGTVIKITLLESASDLIELKAVEEVSTAASFADS
jgi:hypothetical protein